MNPTLTRTLPLLAAALLLASAPAAQASPIASAWEVASDAGDRAVLCMRDGCPRDLEPCERLGGGTLCSLGGSLGSWCDGDCSVGDPTMDRDHDLVADEAEKAFCGRSGARGSGAKVAFARCEGTRDMAGMPDHDRDGLPDWLEPVLCEWEDQNTDADGSCDGGDYRL